MLHHVRETEGKSQQHWWRFHYVVSFSTNKETSSTLAPVSLPDPSTCASSGCARGSSLERTSLSAMCPLHAPCCWVWLALSVPPGPALLLLPQSSPLPYQRCAHQQLLLLHQLLPFQHQRLHRPLPQQLSQHLLPLLSLPSPVPLGALPWPLLLRCCHPPLPQALLPAPLPWLLRPLPWPWPRLPLALPCVRQH